MLGSTEMKNYTNIQNVCLWLNPFVSRVNIFRSSENLSREDTDRWFFNHKLPKKIDYRDSKVTRYLVRDGQLYGNAIALKNRKTIYNIF